MFSNRKWKKMGTPSSQNARPASHNYCTHRKKKLTEQTGRETYDLKKNEVHLNENINQNRGSQRPTSTKELDLEEELMKKVVALNQNYFYDKVKVTDDTKPSQYRLKIPVHMLRSNYKNEFFKKCVEHKTDLIINNDYETQLSVKGPHTFSTNYEDSFKDTKIKKKEKKENRKRKLYYNKKRNEEPCTMQTQYKKDYVNWGSPPINDPIRPTSAFTIVGGGNFMSSTMYNTDFKDKLGLSTKKDVVKRKNFPMFSQVKPEYVTNYSEAFGTKSGGKQQAKKHDDNIIMNLTMKTKKIEDKSPENTIYKTSYTNNWLEEKDTKNQRKTIEQLQEMVLRA